ncbi:MAG TPA: hypothetical protein VMW30_05030 [Candidatus Paceibacterota bacterium]|nr:hypothetical protein [Candidatus Paceibacterota bacterium]
MSEGSVTPPPTPKNSTGKNILIGIATAFVVLAIIGALFQKSDPATSIAELLQTTSEGREITNNTDPMTDKSFHLVSVNFTNNSGFGGADARITNISDRVKSAIFGLTIFAPDGISVAQSLMGSAEEVQPGQTVTVQFVGTGEVPASQFSYAFQVSTEF